MEVAAAVCPTNTSSYTSSGVVSSDSGNSSANSSVSSSSSISSASRLQTAPRMNNTSSSKMSSSNHRKAPSTPNRQVNFGGGDGPEEKKREKFLTAKYGAHQMALIRKRLRVEMWMYERLTELYGAVSTHRKI